jgi:hypothetical protein
MATLRGSVVPAEHRSDDLQPVCYDRLVSRRHASGPYQEQLAMAAEEIRWVVRLTPPTGRTIRDLLEIPLSLDVWHRENDALVAAASEMTLRELERRRLAGVERLCTTEEYETRAKGLSQDDPNAP